VKRSTYRVEILKDHDGGEQGYAEIRLPPGAAAWQPMLRALVDMACSRNKPWAFPGPTERAPDDRFCFDPALGDALLPAVESVGARWVALCEAGAHDGTTPGHLEVTAGRADITVATSRGLAVAQKTTDLYVEGTLTTAEHERFFQQGTSCLGDLALEGLLAQSAAELRALPSAHLPETGRYRVILHRSAIAQLFRVAAFDLLASSIQRGISQAKIGDRLGPAGVSIWVNSPIAGLCRTALDEEGEPIVPYATVREGKITALATSRKYAALTGLPWTSGMTSLQVEGGALTQAELFERIRASGEPVLEVVEFSNFVPDNESKAFAGEIRFGYLHRDTEKIPIRGGSLSGNVLEALAGANLSLATGTDFGNPGNEEIPCHVPEIALLPPLAYAGRSPG
jgi:hypothetical protein